MGPQMIRALPTLKKTPEQFVGDEYTTMQAGEQRNNYTEWERE
jgi:hypothetical protein